MSYRFERTCSYMNCLVFRILEPSGEAYSANLRLRLGDYEASIYNGGTEAYQKDEGQLIGVLRREGDPCRAIPAETVAAFNTWTREKWEAEIAFLRANPARYGEISDADISQGGFLAPLPVVRAAAYDVASRTWKEAA